MANAESTHTAQCRALTEDGNRCSRSPQADGFCHQHDESDPTVSDTQETEAVETGDVDAENEHLEALLAVRQTVESMTGAVIGSSFDGISEITPTEDGWRAVVEVVERTAVPDTQDIIGRYEIDLDEHGVIEGYRRLDRYRRGDTATFEQA